MDGNVYVYGNTTHHAGFGVWNIGFLVNWLFSIGIYLAARWTSDCVVVSDAGIIFVRVTSVITKKNKFWINFCGFFVALTSSFVEAKSTWLCHNSWAREHWSVPHLARLASKMDSSSPCDVGGTVSTDDRTTTLVRFHPFRFLINQTHRMLYRWWLIEVVGQMCFVALHHLFAIQS